MDVPGRESPLQSETPQVTLDMLVFRVLVMGAAHGHTVAHAIERRLSAMLAPLHAPLVAEIVQGGEPRPRASSGRRTPAA